MVRALIYTLLSIFAITFIRMVVGILTRGMGDLLKSELKDSPQETAPRSAGELKPCARCGTYVLATTPFHSTANGAPVFYCSEKCKVGPVAGRSK